MFRRVPLIVILGSTGTGKTKLSIELAQRFNTEIISADSMQVYKGLSIATAKATPEEQSQATHHVIDVVTPKDPFTVVHFRDLALPIIDNLLQKSKIPIIVGGTNYYIESILWHNLVSSGIGKRKKVDISEDKLSGLNQELRDFLQSSSMVEEMETMETLKLHELLNCIDPPMANRIHPNNKRKIMRALEVFKDHGRRMSEIIEDQRSLPGASNLGGPSRYEHVIIFWLQCKQETLNQRLDARVNSMVKNGLLAEIRSFYDDFVNMRNVDYEEGILQTIGFKEFIPYLETFDKSHDLLINRYVESPEVTPKPESWDTLAVCLDELKLVTQRFSKKQLKWIRNRFLGSDQREIPKVYALDTSDVSRWEELVSQPASDAVSSYINNQAIALKPLEVFKRVSEGLNEEVLFKCSTCDRFIIGEYQWQLHMKSNKHKRTVESKRKRAKREMEKANENSSI